MNTIFALTGIMMCYYILLKTKKNHINTKEKIIESNLKIYCPDFEDSVIKSKDFFLM